MEREFSWIESNSQYDEATVESLPSKPPGRPRWICLQCRRPRFSPWVGMIPWKQEWQSAPEFLPGEFHGQRSLAGYGSWGHKGLDTTEWLTLSLSWKPFQLLECTISKSLLLLLSLPVLALTETWLFSKTVAAEPVVISSCGTLSPILSRIPHYKLHTTLSLSLT